MSDGIKSANRTKKTFHWVLRDGSDRIDNQLGRKSYNGSDAYDNIYWISGKPGSGKSTLIKHLLDQPQTREYLQVWKPNPVIISHFFWRPGTTMQQSIKGLLLSLLYQLLNKDNAALDQIIKTDELGMLSKDAETDWSVSELKVCLGIIMSRYPRPILIFLDGFDEVLPEEGAIQLLEVIEQVSNTGDHKICLGSRREPIFVKRLCYYPQLRIEHLNQPDLQRYCKDNIKIPPD
ncbi:hypothetical protein PspLS_01868 [Pyricularia sp. CBS 133598]|nr:hypothetical protein PspLS_01868 [Pyricularia sp. CBS 133598]